MKFLDSKYKNNNCKKNKIIKMYYFSQILLFAASSMFNPVLYLYLTDNGVNVSIIGLFLSSYWIMSAICEIPFGIFTDRFHTKYTLIVSVLIKIIALFFLIYHNSNVNILMSGILFGISEAAFSGCLSSWMVNELEKLGDVEQDTQPILSKGNIFCSMTSLVVSFVVMQYIYRINKLLPITSAIFLYAVCFFYFLLFFRENTTSLSNKASNSLKSIKDIVIDNFCLDKSFFLYCVYFTTPYIMDVGPLNQWTKAFQETKILGYIWIGVNVSYIFSNWILSKVKIKQEILQKILLLDLIIILLLVNLMSYNIYLSILFFIFHAVINGVLIGSNISYLHSNIIKKNRNTMISTFNFFNSIIIGIMVMFLGFLSNILEMSFSWSVFAFLGVIVNLIVFNYIFHERNINESI